MEVAQALDISLDKYRQILLDTNNSQLFSYDAWYEEHGDSAGSLLEGNKEANLLHHLLEGSLRQQVIDAIEALLARTRAKGADAVLPRRVEPEGNRYGVRGGRVPRKPTT